MVILTLFLVLWAGFALYFEDYTVSQETGNITEDSSLVPLWERVTTNSGDVDLRLGTIGIAIILMLSVFASIILNSKNVKSGGSK
jgi:hypothetical protein